MTARTRGATLTLMMAFMVLAGPTAAAWAHPLGNFSVNVHSGLRLLPDEVRLTAIVDTAEIPTRQARPELDADGDDSLSSTELSAAAGPRCSTLAGQLSAVVDGTALTWTIDSADLVAPEGTAGLPTLRLTCALSAPAELDTPTTLAYRDEAGDGRVGWHEIVAVGEGVELVDPSVGTVSPSDELRSYPEELLESPLDQRAVELVLRPGSGTTGTATASPDAPGGEGDALAGLLASGDRLLQNTLGREDLTASVGLLAVLLAVLLGAGHAVLPGHGKTVMAAYLAGRDGTRSDAFVVGATVTLTHTLGVLALGLVVSVGTAVAGERVLARLGLISGLLVAGIGASMLRDALRGRAPGHGHHHGHGHDHEHGDGHTHGHGHGHDGHGHDHGPMTPSRGAAEGDLVVLDRAEPTTPTIVPADGDRRTSRRGLVGMAVAGGLVPSPSALVVLLASVALGRTLLGVSLVLAYGLGMAGTLTAVGLLLVRLRDRFSTVQHGRLGRLAAGLGRVLPALTATLVLVVGLGLAARALIG